MFLPLVSLAFAAKIVQLDVSLSSDKLSAATAAVSFGTLSLDGKSYSVSCARGGSCSIFSASTLVATFLVESRDTLTDAGVFGMKIKSIKGVTDQTMNLAVGSHPPPPLQLSPISHRATPSLPRPPVA